MKKAIVTLFVLTNIFLLLRYQYPFIEVMVSLLNVVLAYFYVKNIKRYQDHLCMLYVLAYIYCSVDVVAILQLNGVGFFKDVISYSEYQTLAIWGNHLYLIVFVMDAILSLFDRRKTSVKEQEPKRRKKNYNIDEEFKRLTIFIYFLCILSIALGLYDATQPARVVLPFHLNGLINETHNVLFPFIFAVYLYDCFTKNRKLDKTCVMMYVVYLGLEIVVTSSKGILLVALIPAFLMVFMCGRFTKKLFYRYCLPLVVLVYLLYPIISLARGEGTLSLGTLSEAYVENKSIDKSEQTSPFVRAFLAGVYYIKVMDEVDSDIFSFDFHLVPYLVLNGGGAVYMTREIDQMPESVHHGSGITGLPDAILWGGHMMCFIILCVFVIIAHIGDNSPFLLNNPPYRLILFLFLQLLIVNRSITFFFDNLFFSAVISIVLKILIVMYYNRKYARY